MGIWNWHREDDVDMTPARELDVWLVFKSGELLDFSNLKSNIYKICFDLDEVNDLVKDKEYWSKYARIV